MAGEIFSQSARNKTNHERDKSDNGEEQRAAFS